MRYKYTKNYLDDCITICDEKEELKTSFDSEIMLSPMEDAETVVFELNKKEAIIQVLYEALLSYEDEQDIEYWMKEALEELE